MINVDPRIAPYYDVTLVLCALVFCKDCGREACYTSTHPPYSDENYHDQAKAMAADGWVVERGSLVVFCPACAAKRGLRPEAEGAMGDTGMNDRPNEPPVQLDYAPEPQRRGWKKLAETFLARLSRPMPLAMYYLIMFVLSLIALVLALIITAIVRAFQ